MEQFWNNYGTSLEQLWNNSETIWLLSFHVFFFFPPFISKSMFSKSIYELYLAHFLKKHFYRTFETRWCHIETIIFTMGKRDVRYLCGRKEPSLNRGRDSFRKSISEKNRSLNKTDLANRSEAAFIRWRSEKTESLRFRDDIHNG